MRRQIGLPASLVASVYLGSCDALCQGWRGMGVGSNTQQTYRPLTNILQPGLRDRAGPLAAVSNGPFGTTRAQKVEYDFYDFGTRNLTFPGTIFGVPEVVPGVNIKKTISTVKFGISYRFRGY